MTTLRWEPTQDLITLQRAMQRGFDKTVAGPMGAGDGPRPLQIPFDVLERDDDFLLRAPVPGFKAEEIDVQLEDGVLTIRGERAEEETVEEGSYRLREWQRGDFRRKLRLRARIDVSAAEASVKDGVLELRLPKAEEVKAKKIEVNAG